MDVWLNGELVAEEDANISVFDSGLQHAVGLFETMYARNNHIFRVDQHMSRLTDSAKTLLMSTRLQPEALAEAAERLVVHSHLDEARIRLTVTGGNMNMLRQSEDGHVDPTILIVAQPPTPYPDIFFSEGVEITIASGRTNPWTQMAGHKTLNYWPRIHALQMAAMIGASEALWLDPAAKITCGCVSNIFMVKNGVLQTPKARGEQTAGNDIPPVLPGITREAVLEVAHEAGIETQLGEHTLDDLLTADEAFLTNSSWHVLPVRGLRFRTNPEEGSGEIETRAIGAGSVGPITARLRADLLELIEQETTPAMES